MTRECHVRFCESAGVRSPRATHLVVKDPDREVQERIALVFTSFVEQGSVGKVMRTFAGRELGLPGRDRFGEVVWRPVTLGRINLV